MLSCSSTFQIDLWVLSCTLTTTVTGLIPPLLLSPDYLNSWNNRMYLNSSLMCCPFVPRAPRWGWNGNIFSCVWRFDTFLVKGRRWCGECCRGAAARADNASLSRFGYRSRVVPPLRVNSSDILSWAFSIFMDGLKRTDGVIQPQQTRSVNSHPHRSA